MKIMRMIKILTIFGDLDKHLWRCEGYGDNPYKDDTFIHCGGGHNVGVEEWACKRYGLVYGYQR